MLTRREFCARMALLAAGAAALPSQVEAFTNLYDVNTRPFGEAEDLIKIHDLTCGFEGAPRDATMRITCYTQPGTRPTLVYALNYRGSFRWATAADDPLLTRVSQFRWLVEEVRGSIFDDSAKDFLAMVSYTDKDMVIHRAQLRGASGCLQDVVAAR